MLAVLVFGTLYKAKAVAGFVHPTYGNTMFHTGMARVIAETGYRSLFELSYGGVSPNFYVPFYRFFVASASVLSGLDPLMVAGLSVVAVNIFIILAAYLLGKELFGSEWAGIAGALFFVLSPEITIYTIRPFPQLLGVAFLLATLYFLQKKEFRLSLLAAVLTAMSHQATAVALGATLLLYTLFTRNRKAGAILLASVVAYFLWQLFATGTLDVTQFRQIALKETKFIEWDMALRMGWALLVFSMIGSLRILREKRNILKRHALIVSFALASFLLAKNEWFGVGIFNDRFLTFLAIALALVAGYGFVKTEETVRGWLKRK